MPSQSMAKQKVWKVVKLLSRGTRYAQPFPVTIDLGEEVSVGSSTICGDQAQALQYILVDCTGGQPSECASGLLMPLYVSRNLICIESLIDRFVPPYLRRLNDFRGALYLGSRDYEADVTSIDKDGACLISIVCICELQVPRKEDESTRNCFYVVHFKTVWSVNHGVSPDATIHCLREVKNEVASRPSMWYPYSRFPVDETIYTYNLPCRAEVDENNKLRAVSPFGPVQLIVGKAKKQSKSS